MGVDYRGRDIGVTEKPLHEPDVNAAFDEERRRRVPEHVGVIRLRTPLISARRLSRIWTHLGVIGLPRRLRNRGAVGKAPSRCSSM